MNTKKIFLALLILCSLVIGTQAQNPSQARAILDKTASVLGRKGGASANFTMSNNKIGTVSGSIAIKGAKYQARTAQAIVWYNGKTQWTYMKKNEEVNITTPSKAGQMTMNPYSFINIYKSGYTLGMKTVGKEYQVHLTATTKRQGIDEMYVNVNKNSYVPTLIKIRQGKAWSTIQITNFKSANQPDRLFTFNAKEFPSAEVIDLR